MTAIFVKNCVFWQNFDVSIYSIAGNFLQTGNFWWKMFAMCGHLKWIEHFKWKKNVDYLPKCDLTGKTKWTRNSKAFLCNHIVTLICKISCKISQKMYRFIRHIVQANRVQRRLPGFPQSLARIWPTISYTLSEKKMAYKGISEEYELFEIRVCSELECVRN